MDSLAKNLYPTSLLPHHECVDREKRQHLLPLPKLSLATPGTAWDFAVLLELGILIGEEKTGVRVRFVRILNRTIMPKRMLSYCGVFVPCLIVFCQ